MRNNSFILSACLQVLYFGAAEGEMGGAGGARPQREGGVKPADPEESTTTARKSAAERRSGQVLYFLHTVRR